MKRILKKKKKEKQRQDSGVYDEEDTYETLIPPEYVDTAEPGSQIRPTPIKAAQRDRVRQRNVQRHSRSFPEHSTQTKSTSIENQEPCLSFVDMQSFLLAKNNVGPLVRKSLLPKYEAIGNHTMSKYILCDILPELEKTRDYEKMFDLLKQNDKQSKRAIVESLQTYLLKMDPSRLLEFNKEVFFIKGPDVVLGEILKSLGDTHTLHIIIPLIFSIISLTHLSLVNGYISEEMKVTIRSTYTNHYADLQTFEQSGERFGIIRKLQESIGQFLRIDTDFRVSEWASYFREHDSRKAFVSRFHNKLWITARISSIFLLGNLTFRRENRDDTASLMRQLLDQPATKTEDSTSEILYIMTLAVHILLNDSTSDKQQMASQCLDIINFILQNFKNIPFSFELNSRLIYHPEPHVRCWVNKYPHIYNTNVERATDALISFLARNLQLEIDLCNEPNLLTNIPEWHTKSCYCLRQKAKITILYPSKKCITAGVMNDYKENVLDAKLNKWFINELDCLIRLHHREDHKNIISLLCFQCVPMPIFYVVKDNNSTNLLAYLTRNPKETGNIQMLDLLEMCVQAIEAMFYLHGKGMVHRDITCDSFRISKEGGKLCIQLATFRMATEIWDEGGHPKRIKTDVLCDQIPTRWSAPESLLRGQFSVFSDIWMIGMLIWEIFNHGAWPFTEVKNMSLDDLMQNVVFYGQRPTDGYLPIPIQAVIKQCLRDAPDERLPLEDVLERLKTCVPAKQTDMLYQTIQETWDNFKPFKKQLKPSYQQKKHNMLPERGIPSSIKKFIHVNDPYEEFYAKQNINLIEKTVFTVAIKDRDIHSEDEPIRSNEIQNHLSVKEKVSEEFAENTFQHLIDRQTSLCLLDEPSLSKDNQEGNILKYKCAVGRSLYETVYHRSFGYNINAYLEIIYRIAILVRDLHKDGWIIRCLRPQDVWLTTQIRVAKLGFHIYRFNLSVKFMRETGSILIQTVVKFLARPIGSPDIIPEQEVYIPRLGTFRKLPVEVDIYDQVTEEISSDLIHWSPPEVINNGFYSQAGDVWSFGMLILQVFSILSIEAPTYYGEDDIELSTTPFSHVPKEQLFRHLTGGSLPDKFNLCPEWLYQLLTKCWETTRTERPLMNEIIENLEQNGVIQHDMEAFSTSSYEEAVFPQHDTGATSTSSYEEAVSPPPPRRRVQQTSDSSTSSTESNFARCRQRRPRSGPKSVQSINWSQ